MQIGMVGMGRMGGNMARRLMRAGIGVAGFDRDEGVRNALRAEGVHTVDALEALAHALEAPRIAWLMVPAGAATDDAIARVAPALSPGDIVVDGGNAYYRDSQRRGAELAERGMHFVDCGVSGGVWGLDNGYALMFGGSDDAAARVQHVMQALAPDPQHGWLHCGPCGAGHFVKMIHNGIEYGMMQAFAEGFALMRNKGELDLDVAAIAETWRHGSVVRSWLLDLTAEVLHADANLDAIAPVVADSGEGRWTALEAVEQGVPAPVMSLALMMRFASQGRSEYGDKLLAMMRNAFGGHAVQKGKA